MRRFPSTLLALTLLTTAAAHGQAPSGTLSLPLPPTMQALTVQGGTSVPCTAGGTARHPRRRLPDLPGPHADPAPEMRQHGVPQGPAHPRLG